MADEWAAYRDKPTADADPWAAYRDKPAPASTVPSMPLEEIAGAPLGEPGQTSGDQIPEAFMNRVAHGMAIGRIVDAATKSAQEGFGEEPIGWSAEHVRQAMDLGWIHDPSRSGTATPLQRASEFGLSLVGSLGDASLRAINAGVYGLGGAFGQTIGELGGQGEQARREAINFANFAMIEAGMGRRAGVSRNMVGPEGVPNEQTIGTLPTTQDFQAGAQVAAVRRAAGEPIKDPALVEQNLRRMWEDQGIHPSEAVADAQNDAFLRQTIAPPSIAAFHGSPYSFDQFGTLEKHALTGEGATSFGHGYYFAENQKVAESYTTVNQAKTPKQVMADTYWREAGQDAEAAKSKYREDGSPLGVRAIDAEIDTLAARPQALYQVRLHVNSEQLLDWDKPLSEQPEVTARLRTAGMNFNPEHTGGVFHDFLLHYDTAFSDITGQPDKAAVSVRLQEAGMPGIKYLDQGSRTTPDQAAFALAEHQKDLDKFRAADPNDPRIAKIEQGMQDLREQMTRGPTNNYVIFDHNNIEITHRNGVPFKPTEITPPIGSIIPHGTPRSELAKTGELHIDNVIDNPALKRVIDNPTVDGTREVPNSWGGSVPLEDPTTFIDREFPRQMTIDGVRFDPAEAAAIHENIEEFVIQNLMKAGWNRDAALRAAFWGWGQPAEHAWYRAHGMDPVHVEEAYKSILDRIAARKSTDIPDNLFKETYPDGDPTKDIPGQIDKPTAAELAEAKRIMAADPDLRPAALGAEVTDPANLPTLAQQPPSAPGRLVGRARAAIGQLFGIGRNIQAMLDPMAVGSKQAMVIAKDAMNTVRRIRWEHMQLDAELTRAFDLEQQTRMWNAADEESVLRQEGKASPHMGLATLTPEEQAMVERLHAKAQSAWLNAVDAGMVEGDGLPAYTPRMVINVAMAGDRVGPKVLNELGRNIFTRTSQMLHRGYLSAEETEAAAKRLVETRMKETGASPEDIAAATEKVQIARNIRTLPLATARLEEAAIWKEMINKIEDVGKAAGESTVAVGFQPNSKWFTIAGNPVFTKWAPELIHDPITGKWTARIDDAGNTVMQRKPIYMPDEFRGPLMSILDEGTSKYKAVDAAQSLYGALMALKGKSMTVILNSPLIHNAVVWSKVAEAAGGREWLGFGLYSRGNRIVNGNPGRSAELIERGLNPMGPRGAIQDITGMMEEPNLQPGRSWTAKVLGAIPGLFSEGAETATRAAIDRAGDFVHNTLLWDRVRDVQFGLADFLSDHFAQSGADRMTADRVATHMSNMIVGSIPKEAMSAGARASANMLLFSRSFTLGNLSVYKQAVMGLPKPILAQIERDFGMTGMPEATISPAVQAQISQTAQSIARRKAFSTIVLSVGMYYIGNSLIQNAFNMMAKDHSVSDEVQGYVRRWQSLMEDVSKDPFELRHMIGRLSATYDNEPQKQDRIHVGYDSDGTAIYARNPLGKYGEELLGISTPMKMLRAKLNPLAGGLLDILENDKGFGRHIYDETDKSLAGDAATAFAVAKHLVMKHLPEQQITGGVDLMHGVGDSKVNALRLLGPAVGFTASVGAPGGMQRGEQLEAKKEVDIRFNLAWPEIKKQFKSGQMSEFEAREALRQIGIPESQQRGLLRNAMNPAGALRGRTLRNFYNSATPQQLQRFQNAQ